MIFFQRKRGFRRLTAEATFRRDRWTHEEVMVARIVVELSGCPTWTVVRAGWANYDDKDGIAANHAAIAKGGWERFRNPGVSTAGMCYYIVITRDDGSMRARMWGLEIMMPADMFDVPVLMEAPSIIWPEYLPLDAACFELRLDDMRCVCGTLEIDDALRPNDRVVGQRAGPTTAGGESAASDHM